MNRARGFALIELMLTIAIEDTVRVVRRPTSADEIRPLKWERSQRGFNLVEMITVITIVGILATIAVPSYNYVITSNRVVGEVNDLLGDMQFARYEAIKEGLDVTICPVESKTSTTCDGTPPDWSNGWIVLSNPANTGVGTSTVLRRQLPFTSLNSGDTLTSGTKVSFNREGFAVLTGTGLFSLHDPTGNSGFTRCLILSAAGAPMTVSAGNSAYGVTCS